MTEPIRYGEHVRAEPGTACILCGDRKLQPYADHCHEHGWVRGDVCPRCNTLMALIDRRITPREASLTHALTLDVLIAHAARCPDCELFGADDLGPTTSLSPERKAAITAQIRPRIDPDLAAEVQAYGDSLGLTFNATVNMLLRISLRAAVAGAAMAPGHDAGSKP